ncbi:DUF6228 family protein [Salinispora tropica]|uniref:DUF6228 family protein n=2 Tax=Salinispora tropica TaxID=168695 RepID=UPI00048DE50A|nr:DUF6228 family protein [Salinispora tropica]
MSIAYCHEVPDQSGDDNLHVIVRCQDDPTVSIRLHDRSFPDEYGICFAVEARAQGLHAELPGTEMWVWDEAWLPDFISQLAADYRGWADERTWQANHLTVRATFHSGGHVALTWQLQPWVSRSDAWQASITTWLEGGEQMSNLAADLREFLPNPGPTK